MFYIVFLSVHITIQYPLFVMKLGHSTFLFVLCHLSDKSVSMHKTTSNVIHDYYNNPIMSDFSEIVGPQSSTYKFYAGLAYNSLLSVLGLAGLFRFLLTFNI